MTDPIRAALDKAAEALWQAESLRAAGRPRLTEWRDESEDTRQKWRFMAAHGNAAFLRALPDGSMIVAIARSSSPNNRWQDAMARAVLAAAKDQPND
jgi:hypothetical protein